MATSTGNALADVLRAAAPEDALDGLRSMEASESIQAMGVSVEHALRGSRPAVRDYVTAYRALTREVLQAAWSSYPDQVVEAGGRLTVLDAKGVPSAAAMAILDEGAVRAPFSAWVNEFGSPWGIVLDLVSRVRESLREVDPLYLPAGSSALAHWDVDDTAILAFVRMVRRELTTETSALDTVAETFGLNDTELGAIFGVRRQAISQWRTEGLPPGRAAKVTTVASVADLLARKLKADRLPGIVRREAEAYGGLSMLGMIAADRHQELLDSVRESFAFSTTA